MSTLKDLNKHLFDQLDRLAKANKDSLGIETDRSKAMVDISVEIVKAHQLQLDAAALIAKHKGGLSSEQKSPLIDIKNMSIEV